MGEHIWWQKEDHSHLFYSRSPLPLGWPNVIDSLSFSLFSSPPSPNVFYTSFIDWFLNHSWDHCLLLLQGLILDYFSLLILFSMAFNAVYIVMASIFSSERHTYISNQPPKIATWICFRQKNAKQNSPFSSSPHPPRLSLLRSSLSSKWHHVLLRSETQSLLNSSFSYFPQPFTL